MMSTQWYALHCKPRMEASVAGQLACRKLEFFYPTHQVRPVNPRSQKIKPWFPGYLFVRLDQISACSAIIKWMPGAVGLVSFDNTPAPVPCRLIEAIRQHVDKMSSKDCAIPRFTRGDSVQVVDGALAGVRGIFDLNLPGSLRARVLLKIMGGQFTRVALPVGLLEPIKQI